MGTPETAREQYPRPCPGRILRRTADVFGMGTIGASAYHFINAPAGGLSSVPMKGLGFGGRVALWVGLSRTFKSSLVYVRQKEDRWNTFLSYTATIGVIGMMRRQGLATSAVAAVVGGSLITLAEGALIAMNNNTKTAHEQNETSTSQILGQSVPETGSGSRVEGLFGKFRFWRAEPV